MYHFECLPVVQRISGTPAVVNLRRQCGHAVFCNWPSSKNSSTITLEYLAADVERRDVLPVAEYGGIFGEQLLAVSSEFLVSMRNCLALLFRFLSDVGTT